MTAEEDALKTMCKFLALTGKKITDRKGHIFTDDMISGNGTIFRFDRGGYLDGGMRPAIETADGYVEYRRKGILHRKDLPAIYDLASGVQEYWEDGKLISVYKEANEVQ